MDGGAPETCSSPFTTAVLGDGPHRLAVRATDALQNAGEWANRDFRVDTSVPEVSFTQGPDGPTRARRPAFAFTSAPGSSFECRLDDVAVGCLTGSFAPAGDLSEGPHVLVVRATNPAGTTGPWASRGFLVDTTGPETVLVTPSPTQSASPTPLIAFHSDESSATFECSIDGSAYSPCVSPWAPGHARRRAAPRGRARARSGRQPRRDAGHGRIHRRRRHARAHRPAHQRAAAGRAARDEPPHDRGQDPRDRDAESAAPGRGAGAGHQLARARHALRGGPCQRGARTPDRAPRQPRVGCRRARGRSRFGRRRRAAL